MVRLIAKISLRLGSAFSGALLFCLRENPGNNGFWDCSAMDCLVHVEPKGTSLLDSSEWRNLSFSCEAPYFSQWRIKTPTCRDHYYCNSDHYFWRVEAASRMLLTMEYVVPADQWVHQQSLLSQKHDSRDRVPAVLWAATCLPGAEAVVGCVHRLPLRGHADDRGVWLYFTGRCLDSCQVEPQQDDHWNPYKSWLGDFHQVTVSCSSVLVDDAYNHGRGPEALIYWTCLIR